MFEISWGELAIVTGLGMALVGKKDLPSAARTVGTQVGRVVGLLQGARARADRFAANNELKQLQNELRSGLRELDAVKAEMAISMSPSRGMVGRDLGATVPSANRMTEPPTSSMSQMSSTNYGSSLVSTPAVAPALGTDVPNTPSPPSIPIDRARPVTPELPPEQQTIAAVVEEEWKRQGIGFSSRAEQGSGVKMDVSKSGSATLAFILQESLIFSQYDRVVQEQENILQSKMSKVIEEKQREKDAKKTK